MKKFWHSLFERVFNYGEFAIIKPTEFRGFKTAKQIFQTLSGKLLTVSGFIIADAHPNFALSECKILPVNQFSTQCVEN